MATFRTLDGFEFETTQEGRTIRCVCRKDGVESMASFTLGEGAEPVPVELIELVARNAWEVGQSIRTMDPPLRLTPCDAPREHT